MIKITLPDGSIREYEDGVMLFDVARSISEGLARNTLGAVVNGQTRGLQERVNEDSEVRFVDFEDKEGKAIFWHTSAHIMALAVQRLYPDVKFAIGPAIDDGFYYDFDTEHRFTPEDLEAIENEMKKIVKEGHELVRTEMQREEAITHFEPMGEVYKVDLIRNLPEDSVISFYTLGEFIDLCRGPHLKDISKVKAVKLMSIAGAYWRGDEKNKMLQRIYGTTFEKAKDLEAYLHRLEEAKRRDHRKIGREMNLFSIQEEGPGFPFFHEKGMIIRNKLEEYWRQEHIKAGYGEIKTPMILNEALWHQSGHWDHYKENMYFTEIDEADYAIKPMNCPGSILIYKNGMYSYRDFPMRWAELGLVHRHELSGALHGLMRVRAFTQDDAHLFMTPAMIKNEIKGVIELCDRIYKTFGFEYHMELSTRPENSMGTEEQWNLATDQLREALEELGAKYQLNEGDGAFYGPKIDFHLADAIGRTWQCGTIQLDFQMPERFDMYYVDDNSNRVRPVMVHRTVLGSMERFMGILIEQFAGKFPLWIAPEQVRLIPVTERHQEFAAGVAAQLREKGFRVNLDSRNEKVGYKIRAAQMEKVPYMLVIGDKEIEENIFTVRHFITDEQGKNFQYELSLEDLSNKLQQEIDSKQYFL
ncbi:threonine--tRNA ligase [Proteiniclasticum sp. QWL-01]|uniref:threonine--tRNA ligase n=1 Tax=Proteiniclasticum sp. QWL-01 TaxID=3036945 RepID=UPI0024108C72|nr:threonine--tRNA ligase [Proteiniclasticum sp. QWL-01]WFF71950.1 threonine--tRNA ligase [Proteiniclasticum sp. QWL-01]